MSCLEIKEVFSELYFHMSVRLERGGGCGGAGWLEMFSSQAPLSGATADFVNDRGGRKEIEALLLIGA